MILSTANAVKSFLGIRIGRSWGELARMATMFGDYWLAIFEFQCYHPKIK
jgi:hypothetical protein